MNNYPYYNPYGYQQQQTYVPQQTYMPQQLNGKIVESEDMVRIQEVPIGTYGVYPKADMSVIYLKSWNGDGTTKIVSYIPIVEETKENTNNSLLDIQKSIKELSKKIDNLNIKSSTTSMTKSRIKKEDDDE